MHSLLFVSKLPFQDPVVIITIVLLILLVIPLILNKVKIPGIVGLILSGVLIGPHGLNLIAYEGSMELLGTIGLMYIMFLVGLELDVHSFAKSKKQSIWFGVLTFAIPLAIGFGVSRYFLGYNLVSSWLVAAMLSTHTLVSYPIISRFGIKRRSIVSIAISGTIITDTAVLIMLTAITAVAKGEMSLVFWLKYALHITLYLIFILAIFPRVSRWFFSNLSSQPMAQFTFALTMVFLAGLMAELSGFEPIIGAFLAGIMLSRQIPSASALMNRIEFVGNSLFIPFFLISVGMLINVGVIFKGWNIIGLSVVLTVIALASKWFAAFIVQKAFLLPESHRKLLFGLSCSRAAATLAVALIGYELGILGDVLLNATVMLILTTSLVSGFITQSAAQAIAVNAKDQFQTTDKHERILVPIANPSTVEILIEFARYLKTHTEQEPLFALAVAKSEQEIANVNKVLQKAVDISHAFDCKVEPVTRVDYDVAAGIVRACKELSISDLVMGWNGRFSPKQWVFGSILEHILLEVKQPVHVVALKHPLNTFNKLNVVVPPLAELEIGFGHILKTIKNLANQTSAKVTFTIPKSSNDTFIEALKQNRFKIPYSIAELNSWDEFFSKHNTYEEDTFYVLISARVNSISFSSNLQHTPKLVSKHLKYNSFAIAYPEQERTIAIDTGTWLSSNVNNSFVESDFNKIMGNIKN